MDDTIITIEGLQLLCGNSGSMRNLWFRSHPMNEFLLIDLGSVNGLTQVVYARLERAMILKVLSPQVVTPTGFKPVLSHFQNDGFFLDHPMQGPTKVVFAMLLKVQILTPTGFKPVSSHF